jgi:hypothetical protein
MTTQSRSVEEMKQNLSALRALSGWFGTRGDHKMQKHLADECWALSGEIERLERGDG